ncbi:MAG: hypothetical protein ACSHWU_07660 [Marinicella sp.]
MKHLKILILLFFSGVAFSTEIDLPDANDSGYFDSFTGFLQNMLNWLTGPYMLFMSLILFIVFVIGYAVKPNAGFISDLMKYGAAILLLIFGINIIVSLYNG